MSNLNIFLRPTLPIAKTSSMIKEGLKPIISTQSHSIYAHELGPCVAFALRAEETEKNCLGEDEYKKLLAKYSPAFVNSIKTIWKNLDMALEKLSESCIDFQALIHGGWLKDSQNPISENSQNLFYELLEGCYKRGIPYSAIGLKEADEAMDNLYVSKNYIYLHDNSLKNTLENTTKNLMDYKSAELEELLHKPYDYVEIAPNHILKGGQAAHSHF